MKRVLSIVGIIAVLACAGWAYQTVSKGIENAKTIQFNKDVDNLFIALQKYKEVVGGYPAGNNSDISRALKGANSKNLIILSGNKENLNDKGEYIDPWGTPLRIYFTKDSVLVRSAGPNRRFDDSSVLNSDDYYRSN